MQAPIIGFMAFCAVPAVVTNFNMPVVHSNTALMTISLAFTTADAAGRAPENVFQKLEKYAISF